MARRTENRRSTRQNTKHRLLVYFKVGRRYRTRSVIFFFMGLLLLLPLFISELENDLVDPEALAAFGGVLMLVGFGLWLFARLAMHRSYVQCMPDLLLVRTPFRRTLVSYRRIKLAQSAKVSHLYPREKLRSGEKALMRDLLDMTAAEVQVKSWPAPKKRLERYLSKFLFSSRAEAWLFIVPNYSALTRQLDMAMQTKRDADRGVATGYEDPIERLKYFDH
ncbi:MAG: hypothetical protein GYB65_08585 [Chloroflexi bacterium]|nr:hypothetical protein [Chloroflexota bacterium]